MSKVQIFASKILFKILPKSLFVKLRNRFRKFQLKTHKPLTAEDIERILKINLGIKEGDHIMVHSSIDMVNTNCSAFEILEIIFKTVGSEGTVLFPCWHFNYRAEDALNQGLVFNVKKSPSVLGLLSEMARRYPNAKRSLHPTNSIVAIGKESNFLTNTHHLDIYPSGTESPFYKLKQIGGKVIGFGVDTYFLSFVHCPEDVLKEKFPFKTRNSEVFDAEVINYNGEKIIVKTLVASPEIRNNDIRKFIAKHINPETCKNVEINATRFFVADCENLYNEIVNLSERNITIYSP